MAGVGLEQKISEINQNTFEENASSCYGQL